MATATMLRTVEKLRQQVRQTTATGPNLERFRQDPTRLLTDAGIVPDPWQETLLRSPCRRALMLATRQAGKSLTGGALALRQALLVPDSLVLLLSPTLRQSGELFRDKVMRLYGALGRPVAPVGPRDNSLRLELANGSRIISLPGTEETIRGYSGAAMLIIDEASRVADSLYYSVRPMLAVSQGRLVCLSTPFGHRGWFFSEWTDGSGWQKARITADQCPRISREFLAEEERVLGPRWYRQEYFCSFEDTVDSVFRGEDIRAALSDDVRPLFLG